MSSLEEAHEVEEAKKLALPEAVKYVRSSGHIPALAAVCVRVVRELEAGGNTALASELLSDLQKEKEVENVAIFLHAFAAAGALENSTALQSLANLGIDPSSLLEYLNPERLTEASVVESSLARKRYQRIIGLETRTMTFDLTQECTFGFSELAVLLIRTEHASDDLWDKVLALVGKYNLEPFRVLCMFVDLVVFDGSELSSENVQWLANSCWRGHPDLPAILSMFLDDPRGVQLSARLTVLGAVSLTHMFAYFDPKPQGFVAYERQIRQEQEAATQSGLNALAMAELLDDDEEDDELIDDDTRQLSEDTEMRDSEADNAPSEEPADADGNLQMMGTALQYLGNVFAYAGTESQEVIDAAFAYVRAYPIIAGSSVAITTGLSRLVCRLFEQGEPSRDRLLELARRYLSHVSHDLSDELWSAINNFAIDDFKEAPEVWTDFFREFMLPSLDFESTSESLLWQFDAEKRFILYNDLQVRVAKDNFFVKNRFAKAEKETKNILKRLTKNDAQEKIVPALLEQFAQCPLPSLAAFVNQVESYNIGSLVARSTTTEIPHLAMDMLPLIIMQQLTAGGRLAQQQDGLYESRWFRLLASFAGEIASQHSEFDFLSLITLVLRMFSQGDYTQIIVLEQLLLRLSGIPLTTNLSIPQIVALGSALGVREMVQAVLTEQTQPSRERLVKALEEHDLLLEVFVALGHVYNHLLLDGTNAKVAANRRDLVAELITLYAELVGGSCKVDVVELCSKYAVPLPFALTLWRFSSKELGSSEAIEQLPGTAAWSGTISADLYSTFWQLGNYDIVFDERLYETVGELRDPKAVEKSALSHKLRIKSVKQRLTSKKGTWFDAPAGVWNPDALVRHLFVPRLVSSPVDAVYTSRFLQTLHQVEAESFCLNQIGDVLFSRGVLLALLHSASPLELESLATFTTDLFDYVLRNKLFLQDHERWSRMLTDTLLEVAVPTQSYIPLSNVFSLLQKAGSVFPMTSTDGEELLTRIHLLTVSLTDGDLETSVKSLYAQLTKRRTLWISQATEDVHATEFYKTMCANTERLELRLLASLRALSTADDQGKPEAAEAKRGKRGRNSDRREREKRSGSHRANSDLLSEINRQEPRSDARQSSAKRADDDRVKGWGAKREKPRRRRGRRD